MATVSLTSKKPQRTDSKKGEERKRTCNDLRQRECDEAAVGASGESVLVNEREGVLGVWVLVHARARRNEVVRDSHRGTLGRIQTLDIVDAAELLVLELRRVSEHRKDRMLAAPDRVRREVREFHLVELLVPRDIVKRQQIPRALRFGI